MKRSYCLLIVAALAFAACGGVEQPAQPVGPDDQGDGAVTGVTLSEESIRLSIGKTYQLTATVHPSNAVNKNVIWTSSETGVASVKGGLVTALKDGTAQISATSVDGFMKASCTVEVSTVPAQSISFPDASVTLVLNENTVGTYQLTPKITPDDARDNAIAYKVVSGSAVSVDGNGLVTATSLGQATVRASALDGGNARADVNFSVQKEAIFASSLSVECATEMVAGRTQTCKVTYSPPGTNMKGITVSSSDPGVAAAEVDNTESFTLRALKAGSCRITVSYAAGNGVPDYSFVLYVHENEPAIAWDTDFTGPAGRIDDASRGMIPGETFTLRAHVDNLHENGVTYELVGTSSAVTLTEDGLLTAKAYGSAKVRARSRAVPTLVCETRTVYVQFAAASVSLYFNPSGYNNMLYKYYSAANNTFYIKRGVSQTFSFELPTGGGNYSRPAVRASVSSNLQSALSVSVANYQNQSKSGKTIPVADVTFTAAGGSGTVSGTVTITQIGSSVKLTVPVVVCLYEGTDIKPGDNLVFSSPSNPFPGSSFVRTSSQFKIVDGGWRGGDVFFGGSPTVSSNATAIIVWLGRPGQSGGRLYSMSFDKPDNVASGIHGYAIGLKDASSSGGTILFGGPGSDMDNNDAYLGGSGNYKGSGGIKASATGRYGFEQTQGLLAYNFYHGSSNHFRIVHYLHDCDRSGSTGNLSSADVYSEQYWTGYPDLYRNGSDRKVYASAWFIPSAEEWQLMTGGFGVAQLNTMLTKGGFPNIRTNSYYWTPRQKTAGSYYLVRGDGGDTSSYGTSTQYAGYLRPFIAF